MNTASLNGKVKGVKIRKSLLNKPHREEKLVGTARSNGIPKLDRLHMPVHCQRISSKKLYSSKREIVTTYFILKYSKNSILTNSKNMLIKKSSLHKFKFNLSESE